jgi:protein tyrosine phosphatase (PTP) superfamily phosphohydrolase (DUF442 family)
MALADIKNFLEVDPCIGSAGQPSAEQLAEIVAAGYSAIINLGLLDPKYCLPDEAGLVASLGIAYEHIPVLFDAPKKHDFLAFLAAMDRLAAQRVFVHCAANYRVSTFLALYGELRLGWARERADALARQLWQPNATWLEFMAACRTELMPEPTLSLHEPAPVLPPASG